MHMVVRPFETYSFMARMYGRHHSIASIQLVSRSKCLVAFSDFCPTENWSFFIYSCIHIIQLPFQERGYFLQNPFVALEVHTVAAPQAYIHGRFA